MASQTRNSLVFDARSGARLLGGGSLALVLMALSVVAAPASLWAIRGPVDGAGWLTPPGRMALVWAVAAGGALVVVLCSRRPRTRPLFSRRIARVMAPWITACVIAWLAFTYWLGFIGAGAQGITFAFAMVLSCASALAPVACIGTAFKRRYWAWLLPMILLLSAVLLYVAYYQEFFGR